MIKHSTSDQLPISRRSSNVTRAAAMKRTRSLASETSPSQPKLRHTQSLLQTSRAAILETTSMLPLALLLLRVRKSAASRRVCCVVPKRIHPYPRRALLRCLVRRNPPHPPFSARRRNLSRPRPSLSLFLRLVPLNPRAAVHKRQASLVHWRMLSHPT